MPFTRESVIAAWLDVVDASTHAREAMSSIEHSLLEGVTALRRGGSALDALAAAGVKGQRADLDASWRLVRAARHRFRVVLVGHCLADGLDVRAISEVWGFSREAADALVREARELEVSYN